MFLSVKDVSDVGPDALIDLYAETLVGAAKSADDTDAVALADLSLLSFELACRYQEKGLARDAVHLAGQQARFELGRDEATPGEGLLRSLGRLNNLESAALRALDSCQRALTPAYAPTA